MPEVESEGELAPWEDLSSSGSETEGDDDPRGLEVPADPPPSAAAPPAAPGKKEPTDSLHQEPGREEGSGASSRRLQPNKSKSWWQKATQIDLISPLLLPVLLLRPQEKPSDLVFSRELMVGSDSESSSLYLERPWESLEEQLATSASRLQLSPHLTRCRSMAQHVARLVRVLARPRQHGLLLSGAQSTGRRAAVTLAAGICQARLFHLPSGPEGAVLQCLQDASWHAGMFGQPVALLVPEDMAPTSLHRLLALATSGSFPDQYTEADLDRMEEHLPGENLGAKQNSRKEGLLQR